MEGSYLDEILEQPGVLAKIAVGLDRETEGKLTSLSDRLASGAFSSIILTGMGGSLIGSYPSWLELTRGSDVPVLLIDAAELTQQVPGMIGSGALIIATSQSGESGEIVHITRLSQQPGGSVSVTNGPGNSLANWADITLFSNAGRENTVSTKSYTGGLAVLHLLCAHLIGGQPSGAQAAIADAGEGVADFTATMLERNDELAEFLGWDTPICFIGRGYSYTSAQISSLVMLESAKLHCIAFSGGQFRHGPVELLREGFVSVFFFGDESVAANNIALLETILHHGGKVLVICNGDHVPGFPESDQLKIVSFPQVAPELAPILEVIPAQTLQIPLSIARGFVPGAFLNASKVTSVK